MRTSGINKDQIFHIYNRGVNRQNIFFEKSNWFYFLKLMKKHFKPEDSDILAYCLMPNHFHVLARIKCENFGNKVMMPFTVSYTRSINEQEKRVGSLFQGTYKSKLIESDESLMHVSRYIHLNPLKSGLVDNLEDWEFSSYPDYIGVRNGRLPYTKLILALFPYPQSYKTFVEEDQSFEIKNFIFDD